MGVADGLLTDRSMVVGGFLLGFLGYVVGKFFD